MMHTDWQRRKILAGLVGWMVVASLPACSPKPEPAKFRSVDISQADYGENFRLRDFNGQERSLGDFKGKVVVMFFGYTQCPDVCPTTLAEMAQVKRLLGEEGDKFQLLFVSVDPERDTPEMLKEYMGNFDPDFLGLLPDSPHELEQMTRDFKIYYAKVQGSRPDTYTIDHTASAYVFDQQGKLRLLTRYGVDPQFVADDIKLLLAGA